MGPIQSSDKIRKSGVVAIDGRDAPVFGGIHQEVSSEKSRCAGKEDVHRKPSFWIPANAPTTIPNHRLGAARIFGTYTSVASYRISEPSQTASRQPASLRR